ncbi:MAG TPA: protein kinase [Candidatus Krumholzibacteria bacterium]|nr:protein kinase [Candidatus Krumholzibacteria bacterium]
MSEGKSYRILETVASGGTAVLYRALQISLERIVAVKRLHAHLTQDENFTRRFVLEAKAAASLDHQNIVRVIDFGVEEGSYQMVMEFVEGESLKEVFERWRPMQPELALAIVHQVCRGLEHAHAKGIVHRDIKPGNIMVTKAGVAKITDFGLAKLTQSNSSQTAADSILGTPLYMSPEQAFGESVDQRSDLFSLGTVLYELLTGRQPFAGENYMGVIQNIINKEIPAVRDVNPNVPLDAEHIVMRALAKNRDERFRSAREFREAIESVLGHDGLHRATAELPALLDKDGHTRVLTRSSTTPAPSRMSTSSSSWSTVSSVKKRQRGLPLWASMAVVAIVLGGGATWFFWPRLHAGAVATVPGDVQKSAMDNVSGFDPTADGLKTSSADSLAGRNTAADSAQTRAAAKDTTATQKSAEPAPVKTPDVASATPPPAPEKVETTPAAADTVAKPAKTTIKPKPHAEGDKPFRQGYLMINCEPAAQVYINGIYRGDAAPTLRLTLPVGLLSIECRANGHEPYLESMRVIPDEMSQRTITLRAEMGIISLTTTEGAEFYVDGELIGVTPIMHPISVAAGSHTLMLKRDGYFTWTSTATVTANGTLPLHITLSQRY